MSSEVYKELCFVDQCKTWSWDATWIVEPIYRNAKHVVNNVLKLQKKMTTIK